MPGARPGSPCGWPSGGSWCADDQPSGHGRGLPADRRVRGGPAACQPSSRVARPVPRGRAAPGHAHPLGPGRGAGRMGLARRARPCPPTVTGTGQAVCSARRRRLARAGDRTATTATRARTAARTPSARASHLACQEGSVGRTGLTTGAGAPLGMEDHSSASIRRTVALPPPCRWAVAGRSRQYSPTWSLLGGRLASWPVGWSAGRAWATASGRPGARPPAAPRAPGGGRAWTWDASSFG